MAQITYTNKVALNENPEIANINKVTDDDMNEIKQVVNDNYNNTIQITDTEPTDSDNKIWIDTGEVGSAASEITNEYSTSTGLGYSANYVNNLVETIQIQSTIEFTSYQSIITNNTLGVDDCTDYIWYVQATGQSWEYMPIISQVTSSQILLRCWKLNGTGSANVSLLNSASILLLITGIKKI